MSEEEKIERVIEGLGIAVGDNMTAETRELFLTGLAGFELTPVEQEIVNDLSEQVAKQILTSLEGIQ